MAQLKGPIQTILIQNLLPDESYSALVTRLAVGAYYFTVEHARKAIARPSDFISSPPNTDGWKTATNHSLEEGWNNHEFICTFYIKR